MPQTNCYYNLKKGVISYKTGSQLTKHSDRVLIKNARFTVREGDPADIKHGTRQWTLANGQKCVHAYVKGKLVWTGEEVPYFPMPRRISYNPYKQGYFYDKATGEPIYEAPLALVTAGGIWVY